MILSYEVRFKITRALFVEWASHPNKKSPDFFIWIAAMGLCFYFAFNSIMQRDNISAAIYAIFLAFCAYRAFIRSRIMSSRYYQSLAVSQGAKEWERIIILNETIKVIDGNVTSEYNWDQIVGLKESPKYVILLVNKRLCIRLPKNAFVNESWEIFRDSMKSRLAK